MPHTFYRVFYPGDEQLGTLNLLPYDNLPREPLFVKELFSQDDILQLLQATYPGGISYHGEQYLFGQTKYHRQGSKYYTPHQPMLELTYELVRQAKYPQAPSRFTSFFGWTTLADAHDFNRQFRDGHGIIRQVTCENYLQVDMNLLYLGVSLPAAMLLAERYWRGESSPTPHWEVLMSGPIQILEGEADSTGLDSPP